MERLHILIINLDNLMFTRDCIQDLMNQIDMGFDLTLVDNASLEPGICELLTVLEKEGVHCKRYEKRGPLIWIWNAFYEQNQNEFLCFLNNDTRLSINYTKTIKQVFDKEPNVAIVGHVSNNIEHKTVSDELDYRKFYKKMRQGWDFTIRREDYKPIPERFKIYFGDDIIYNRVYDSGRESAMILNAPIVHYLGQSVKSLAGGEYYNDRKEYLDMGYRENYSDWSGLSKGKPGFDVRRFFINDFKPKITINIVTYERLDCLLSLIRQFLAQTNPYFCLDIWQDGPDEKKRAAIEEIARQDKRIHYSENPVRANKYGHDMRHKSIMACQAELWVTFNDDNLVSPLFIEEILKAAPGYDMVKYAVAMKNIPRAKTQQLEKAEESIINGETGFDFYGTLMKTLDSDMDKLGDVDACSFAVRPEIIRNAGGWWSMEFSGDWEVYKKMLNSGIKINRLKKVLSMHR